MLNGIVDWGESVSRVMSDGQLLVKQVQNSDRTPLVSVLLEGAPGTGKTALASKLAVGSDFPLIILISLENMVGLTELSKVTKIKKVCSIEHLLVCSLPRLLLFRWLLPPGACSSVGLAGRPTCLVVPANMSPCIVLPASVM